jgi:hypothetical protein
MVKPYLSRLRPAENGPRLRPRARSQFEPARTFPVDGPSAGILGLSPAPAIDAETADLVIELDEDQALPAAAPGDRELTPVRAALPEDAAPERGPALPSSPAAGLENAAIAGARELPSAWTPVPERAALPERAAPDLARAPADAANAPPVAGLANTAMAGARVLPPARTARPGPPPAPAPAMAVTEHGHQVPRADAGDFRPPRAATVGREHDQAPRGATRRAPLDQPVHGTSRERAATPSTPTEAAPAQHPPRVPDRPTNPMSRPAEDPADRVQAMARWLRDADPSVARPSSGSPRGPLGGTRHGPGSTADAEVTVTIGRIEVRAPAAAPAPARPQPGGPRQRVPSLDDYLASRTRGR